MELRVQLIYFVNTQVKINSRNRKTVKTPFFIPSRFTAQQNKSYISGLLVKHGLQKGHKNP